MSKWRGCEECGAVFVLFGDDTTMVCMKCQKEKGEVCPTCGTGIKPDQRCYTDGQGGIYCSQQCWTKAQRPTRTLPCDKCGEDVPLPGIDLEGIDEDTTARCAKCANVIVGDINIEHLDTQAEIKALKQRVKDLEEQIALLAEPRVFEPIKRNLPA